VNRTSGSRLYINTDNYGAWYANRAGGDTSLQYSPLENTLTMYRTAGSLCEEVDESILSIGSEDEQPGKINLAKLF